MSMSRLFPTLRLLASRTSSPAVAAAFPSQRSRPSASLVRLFSVGSKILQEGNPKSNTLYVGNLDFGTTEESLAEVFDKYEKFQSARIITRDGQSKGFGYVEFADADAAEQAKEARSEMEIEGRMARLDYATARTERTPRGPGGSGGNAVRREPSPNVFIGGLPYHYLADDVRAAVTEVLGSEPAGLRDVNLPNRGLDDEEIAAGFPVGAVNKGFGYFAFQDTASAEEFVEAIRAKVDAGEFTFEGGRYPKVDFSNPRPERPQRGGFGQRRGGGDRDGGYGGSRYGARESGGGYGGRSSGGFGGNSRGGREDRGGRGSYGGNRRSYSNDGY